LAVDILNSVLERETKAKFDLSGVTAKLGDIKLKLDGEIEVTILLPKKK